MTESKLNRVVKIGTECAGFFLFHPADLAHRKKAEMGWHMGCGKELSAGRLIACDTGGDGGFSFRITDGDLTELERQHLICSWDFRFVVRHKRVFLDGGDNLPGLQQGEDPLDENAKYIQKDCWINIANGNYRVGVFSIRYFSRPDYKLIEGLTSYVIRFQPVKDLESIKPTRGTVMLFHDEDWKAEETLPKE